MIDSAVCQCCHNAATWRMRFVSNLKAAHNFASLEHSISEGMSYCLAYDRILS
jgi:hypothetical protein